VKFSFLEYRYAPLVEPVEWAEYGCRLAGLEDLACMKLSAIGGRGAKKDFIDIYALGRTRFTKCSASIGESSPLRTSAISS
jgi:hypothetical protein